MARRRWCRSVVSAAKAVVVLSLILGIAVVFGAPIVEPTKVNSVRIDKCPNCSTSGRALFDALTSTACK